MDWTNEQVRNIINVSDYLEYELRDLQWYAFLLEREIIAQIDARKELFNKTIEFFTQHIPFGEEEVINDYKKFIEDLIPKEKNVDD